MARIEFTTDLHNYLVDLAERRSKTAGTKGVKKIQDQHELFMGAIATLDFLNGQTNTIGGESSITPQVFADVLRGNLISKIEPEKS